MKELRVCRYLRKSRDDGSGETLEETLERHARITESMARDLGVTISETYQEVVSGESISDRPEMQRLLQDLKSNKWDMVIVVEISRLSRGDGSDQQIIINAFKLTNTKVASDYRTYDLHNDDDLELFEAKLQTSRREYKAITKRLDRGRRESVKDGYAVGGIEPYGLTRVKDGKRYTYITNDKFENYLEIIRFVHDTPNVTYGMLQRHLFSLGIKSPKGKDKWQKPSLEYMINNDAYIGIAKWGVHKTEEYLGDNFGAEKRTVINHDPLTAVAKWPAFIDPDYLKEAREKLNRGLPSHRDKELVNPLSGLLKCGKCGYALAYRKSLKKRYAHYVHADWAEKCGCKAAQTQVVMEVLSETIERTIHDIEFKITDSGQAKLRKQQEKNIERVEKEIKATEQKRIEAYDRLDRGVISEDIYQAIEQRNIETIENLKQSLATLKSELIDVSEEREKIANLKTVAKAIKDDSLTPKQLNDILRMFISRIDYYNDAKPRTREQLIRLDIFLR